TLEHREILSRLRLVRAPRRALDRQLCLFARSFAGFAPLADSHARWRASTLAPLAPSAAWERVGVWLRHRRGSELVPGLRSRTYAPDMQFGLALPQYDYSVAGERPLR